MRAAGDLPLAERSQGLGPIGRFPLASGRPSCPSVVDPARCIGPVKELEMSRSVLPSSRRLEARRDLERARRRARRRVASQLRRYQGRVDSSLEAWLDHEVDVAWWPSAEIYGIVLERRDGDKIAPLIRWARAPDPPPSSDRAHRSAAEGTPSRGDRPARPLASAEMP